MESNFDIEDCYINMFETENQIYELYGKFSDKELKIIVEECLNDSEYKSDDFTDMVKSIISKNSFSHKQRDVLFKHLSCHIISWEEI